MKANKMDAILEQEVKRMAKEVSDAIDEDVLRAQIKDLQSQLDQGTLTIRKPVVYKCAE